MSLREVYDHLYRVHGPQSWWPAKTPFEVMVGAVLTQNTAWTNVEKAIANLHGAEAMEAECLLVVLAVLFVVWLWTAGRAGRAARGVAAARRLLQREGAAPPQFLRMVCRCRRLRAPAAPGNRATARGSLERQGHRPRNRGRHPALRVSPPGVRDRCVHPPHPYTARSRAR